MGTTPMTLRAVTVLGLGCFLLAGICTASEAPATNPPSSAPRASAVAVQDPAATAHFTPNTDVVRRLVDRGIAAFSGKPTASEGWKTLLRPTDTVGFKVTSGPGDVSGTRPAVVRGLVESLRASGHPPDRIVIWDKRSSDLRNAGWYRIAEELGVRCQASEDAGWDPNSEKGYEKSVLGRLVSGDLEFSRKDQPGAGRRSYISRLLTQELQRIIPVAPVLNHNVAGVNGNLLGLAFASVDNTLRFVNNPGLYAEVVPEICALDDVFPKIAFCVSDALICQYRGEDTTRLHNAVVLNELRFSRDPVALDILAIADIEQARGPIPESPETRVRADLYANAELLDLGVADPKRIDVKRPNP
ncbi:MAG: DUF362 domain-containing protein [Verrucomicrobiales bacterium]|nr:DUF362 domain-containing protein [Verrucomicrobiales bacterium]